MTIVIVFAGIFGPDTRISEVLAWLAPLLLAPGAPQELYTAPPRSSLSPDSSLMELGLFPAALVHWASSVTYVSTVECVRHFVQSTIDLK